ncbi:MAG: branched-chain alpha-keto acid dehydrogenase subunit E2 [Pseudonocardiales bacterium]|nr:MAG: branched-chain alpha-keto acid dehydrogenase subunit E2 [Pseudonocardiales bacterium]
MTIKQFKLPDLGEGLTDGDILKWMVAVGDTVDVNDTICEVETVKAAVELPSPFAGVVTALHAAEGETVLVGAPIISIDVAVGATASAAPAPADAPEPAVGSSSEDMVPTPPEAATGAEIGAAEERQMTLVGYGPQEGGSSRRRRKGVVPEPVTSVQTAFNVPPGAPTEPETQPARPAGHRVLAKPPVRKLAKTLGVDLASVPATGPRGTVSRDDVAAAADSRVDTYASNGQLQVTTRGTNDHSVRETRIPIKGVRKHTAAAMVASAFTAPHVTEFVTIDITPTMELRDRVAKRRDFRDIKVSPLLLVAKAVILAAAKTPEINSTWDDAAGEIVVKHYVNLGIAAATERGLIVPNIKDADALSLRELAGAIGALTDTARSGKTSPADMSGGTITITNVGVFGVDTGTPILNPGEAGIVAFGAVRRMPWVVGSGGGERIEPRWVTQLAVSFDHRVVDGQQGSQFLSDVAAVLSDPGLALL